MELSSSSYNSSLKPRLQVAHLHHSQKLFFSFSLIPVTVPHLSTSASTAPRRRFFVLTPPRAATAASSAGGGGGGGGGGRRVYRQSQVQKQRSLPAVPVKEITSFIVPAGAFLAITFGRNLGDEGLFFLAENLGYNHVGASVYLLQSQSLRATLNELQSSPNEMFETSMRHCLWFLQKMKINVHRAVLFSECRGSGLFW